VEGWEARSARGGSRDADRKASVARAEALFASLTEQAEQRRQEARLPPGVPQPAATAVDPAGSASAEPRPLTDDEVYDLFVAARAASERTVRAVRAVQAQANATSDDLAAIGTAIEEALRATNERLDSLERALPDEVTADDWAGERAAHAMTRLHRTLRRAARGKGRGTSPQ